MSSIDFLSTIGTLGASIYHHECCQNCFFKVIFISLNTVTEMEKAMAPHSSTLAWKIPWTEEPGRLRSMASWRVRHNWATSLSRTGERNGNPLQCSCLEYPRDGRAWWAAVHGVTQSRTRLKRLSSSSSSHRNFSPVTLLPHLEIKSEVFVM